MGHIVAMDDSPAQLALTHYARSLWQKLAAELPASVEYEERGTLLDRRRRGGDGAGASKTSPPAHAPAFAARYWMPPRG